MRKIVLIALMAVLCLAMATGCSQPKEEATEEVAGGYTEERDLTAEDQAIFDEATSDVTDATYEPVKVSTQVVAGTNYKFYAKATATADGAEKNVYITIFKSLDDEPATISDIVDA